MLEKILKKMVISSLMGSLAFTGCQNRGQCLPTHDKKVIAHRGASAYATENTTESFTKAVEMGADYIEFDIRSTKDNVFVVYHDSNIGKSQINDTNYDDLRQLCKNRGFDLPKLKEVVGVIGDSVSLDAHLKTTERVTEAVDLMLDSVNEERIMITSEHMDALSDVRSEYPDIKLGYIMLKENPIKYTERMIKSRMTPKKIIDYVLQNNVDFLVPYHGYIGKGLLKEAEKSDVKILPWTLNSKKSMNRFLQEKSVYGIITDKPDILCVPKDSHASNKKTL